MAKVYLVGREGAYSTTVAVSNVDGHINAAIAHMIGRITYASTGYFDGVLSEICFVDGASLDPTYFGEFNAFGQWVPKRPSVTTWGTNGFYLDGEMSGTTVLDKSGNGNNWTAVNGATETLDSPGDKASANAGNYARLSPIDKGTAATVFGAGLALSINGANGIWGRATMPVGPGMKVYFEVDCVDQAEYRYVSCGAIYDGRTGTIYGGTSGGGTFPTWGSGAQLAIAADHDAGTVAFYRSGVLVTTVTGVANLAPWVIQLSIGGTSDPSGVFNVRFDPSTFVFTSPEGFTPLCTAHMPTKVPKNPRAQMGVVTYAGTSAPQTIGGLEFRPDFIWIKERTIGEHHRIFDSVRGLGVKNKEIGTSLTYAEGINSSCAVTASDDGFSFSDGSSTWSPNFNTATYVAWCLGGLTHMTPPQIEALVTATGATITPSAIAYDATLGMAIIKWTGNQIAGATLPHPLGREPAMVVTKSTTLAKHWAVYHAAVGATGALFLNRTDAAAVSSVYWNNAAPTAQKITLGSSDDVNSTGVNVSYLFANTNAIKVGSYTGNGSADGPFVDLGGCPLWNIVKRTDASGYNWHIHDKARSPFNLVDDYLVADAAIAESTAPFGDFCASGLKLRTDAPSRNATGATYIYLAFIDHYFGGGNVAQGRAR
ncbi:MAG: hypothetical protein IH626_18205 [Rhodospirillales bacterium]|nr:hypothetical protein [Rhodospirillales bacterium]